MTEYDNSNRGALFRNKDRKSDKHPDYSGSINVDGVDYWLSGWLKEGRSGKFFSLYVKPKAIEDDARTIERFRDSAGKHFGRPTGIPEKPRSNGGPLRDDDVDSIPF